MGRWLKDRWPLFLVGGAVVGLAGAFWLLFSLALPRAVQSALSGALGVPVYVAGVRPTWPPLRLRLSGVRVGPEPSPVAKAARVYIHAGLGAWLGGDTRAARLEVWGPQVHLSSDGADTAAGILRRMGRLAAEDGKWGIASILIDEVRIHRDGASPLVVSGFGLSAVELARRADGLVSITADLGVMNATGRLVADVEFVDDAPQLLLGAEIDEVSLSVLVRSREWRLGGRASGRVWYECGWAKESSAPLAGGEILGRDVSLEVSGERLLWTRQLRVDALSVDSRARRVDIGRVEAAGVELAPTLASGNTDGESPPWTWRVDSAQVDHAQWVPPPRGPPFILERLELRKVASSSATGELEMRATYAGGRVVVDMNRPTKQAPGAAHLRVEGVPLERLLDGRLGEAVATAGVIDADLDLQGPPGLSGRGVIELRNAAVALRRGGEDRPLVHVGSARFEADHLSFFPRRVRLRRAVVSEPRVWLRRDSSGIELLELLEAGFPESSSLLDSLYRALGEVLGEAPVPTTSSPPLGIRVSDGGIEVMDATVVPEFRLRLRRVQGLIDGPAGTAGPLFLRAEARGPLRSRFELTGDTSTRGVAGTFSIADGRLRDFDSYFQEFSGYQVDAGRIDLVARARLRPLAAADIDLGFEKIELRETGDGDALLRVLGAPLPEVVSRLEGGSGRGRLSIQLQGDPDAPGYGFSSGLSDALRDAVDLARSESENPGREGP